MLRLLLPLALLLAGLAAGCRSAPERESTPPYPALESAELGSMRNVSRSGELWFGSTPSEEDLDLAARRGIVRVIDLSTPEERAPFAVAELCERKGLAYVVAGDSGDVEVELDELESDAVVDRVLAELREHPGEQILLFCGNGTRCATFVAIHRAVNEGVPLDQALVEARRAGMKPGEPEAFVRGQVQRVAGEEP